MAGTSTRVTVSVRQVCVGQLVPRAGDAHEAGQANHLLVLPPRQDLP